MVFFYTEESPVELKGKKVDLTKSQKNRQSNHTIFIFIFK